MIELNDEITKILTKEGGVQNNPNDMDGKLSTKFGITAATLEWFLGRKVTEADMQALTLDVAKEIYAKRYIVGPGFDKLPQSVLQSNIVDFGVMSGPQLAILNLQEILGITADGVIGPQTLNALQQANLSAVNRALIERRCLMAARICKKNPTQLTFLVGWLKRFLSFNE